MAPKNISKKVAQNEAPSVSKPVRLKSINQSSKQQRIKQESKVDQSVSVQKDPDYVPPVDTESEKSDKLDNSEISHSSASSQKVLNKPIRKRSPEDRKEYEKLKKRKQRARVLEEMEEDTTPMVEKLLLRVV